LRYYSVNKDVEQVYDWMCRGQWLDYDSGDIDAPEAKPRLWTNKDFNYDNVGISLLSLFTAATFEGWPE